MSNIYFISKNMEISIYLIFIQKIRRNRGVDDYFLKIVILNRDKLKFTHFLINLEVDCHTSVHCHFLNLHGPRTQSYMKDMMKLSKGIPSLT